MKYIEWLCDCATDIAWTAFGIIVAALFLVAISAAVSSAGQGSASSDNSLLITSPVTDAMPQAAGAEHSILSGLHISGFFNQRFGMWQNPTALRDFTPSRNNLAVARTWLQTDVNFHLNDNNKAFLRTWFVYEPPYSFNSANNAAYGAATPFHSSYGHLMNDYYNNYQVRDAWWENTWGPLDTYIGNQIVVWGQSIAFRVGDVVNPTDTCWAFGFANLEQSRVPQWMIHPILNLPDLGPLSANFLELVVEPGFSPNYWPEQTGDPYDKYRSGLTAGRVDPCFPAASHGPSARFDIHYDHIPVFPYTAPLGPGPYGPSGAGLVAAPASREFFLCSQLAPEVLPGYNPYPVSAQRPCRLNLNKNQGNYGPIGDGTLTDTGYWHVPGMQPENWNIGVRYHTLWGANEITLLYYDDNVSGGSPWSLKWTPYTNLWNYSFYPIQIAGATLDRPVPMPVSLGEMLPLVFRGEATYTNHVSFEDMALNSLTGQGWSDVVKWMVALDLDQAYAPWLTKTGNLTANIEVEDQIVMNDRSTFTFGNDLSTHQVKNDVNVLLNIGTSWWWSAFAPTWTMIYNPMGNNMALFPSIVLTPPWTNKYFMKLQAIEILGNQPEQNVGLFKGESFLTAEFQYNFSLM